MLWWQAAAPAQTINDAAASGDGRVNEPAKTGFVAVDATANLSSYAPLTTSERLRLYFIGTYGPGAIVRAAAAGGVAQWTGTPKEWKQGSDAFADRFGNSFAEHVIRKTLESGAAVALHEDNRYFPSTDTGFWKRTRHAVGSVLMARNQTGREHIAYSRIGAALGSSFISRAWQPPSATTSGDAAVNFGLTMGIDMGWNVFKEFCPARLRGRL
jgi:hypothetical protein